MDVSTKELSQNLTKEALIESAKKASEGYTKLKEKFPLTARALVYSSVFKENPNVDDPDVLMARQAIFDITSNNELNFRNLVDNRFDEKDSVFNLDEVNRIFETIHEQTSAESANDLYSYVHQSIDKWRKTLKSENSRFTSWLTTRSLKRLQKNYIPT